MKRNSYKVCLILFSIFLLAFSLFSCVKKGAITAMLVEEQSSDVQIVVKIQETDGKANAFDALKSLQNQDLLSFEHTTGAYGAYITSINGKAEKNTESTLNSSKGYSWILYTSDMEYAYDTETITIGETVCGKSSLGASSLILKAGEIYVWVYEYYEYEW